MELTPELEQRIVSFAEQWAMNVFHTDEVKAHLSRDEDHNVQEVFYDWEDEGQLLGYKVCIDMPGFSAIRTTVVLVSASVKDDLKINDSTNEGRGCAVCEYGHIRGYIPDKE